MNPSRPPVNHGRSAGTSIAGAWLLLALVARAPAAGPAWADLELHRPPVPDERNAAADWAKAAALWKTPDAAAGNAFDSAWDTVLWAPSPAADRACAENTAALGAIDASLTRAEAQWAKWDAAKLDPAVAMLPAAQKARVYLARRSQAEGKRGECTSSLLGSARLGERMCAAHGALIHYMVGNSARLKSERAIRAGALMGLFDAGQLESLAKGLPPLDREAEVFADVIRVEWTDCELPAEDVVRLAERQTEAYRKMPELADLLVPEALRRVHRIFWEPSLVAGHPAPFDPAKSHARMAGRYRLWLANLGRPWRDQEAEISGVDAESRKLLVDAAPLLRRVEKEPLPLSKKAIARIRPLYNRIENPIGRLRIGTEDMVKVSVNVVFRARAEREATRAIVALARFRTRFARWPGNWSDLVDAGFLDAPPADPFSGGPLQYSAARAVIWSVGQDGKDDGGGKSDGGIWTNPDAVWPLEPRKGTTP